ncbi:cystatin-like [Emydura macquarii macquarii]|uniref:cystatin-like n=1 Tax=Emydura macquarii macquarii TaxID=1129001 RepID=UPI00352BBE4E
MAFPAAAAGPWLCLLLLVGVPFTFGDSLAGGLHPLSVSDPKVQQGARQAVQAYNQRSKSLYYSRAVQVLSAHTQVVSGSMLHLTMNLEKTLCKKSRDAAVDLSKCRLPPPSEQKKVYCKFQIWSQPWLNKTQISQQCK